MLNSFSFLDGVDLPYKPNVAQRRGLEKLKELREDGEDKGVICLPPGSGKTYLSLLDTLQVDADRILYLIHQREILKDAYKEFRKVYDSDVGIYYSGSKRRKKHMFSTIQTMYKDSYLKTFERDSFDYIIVDEFHHSTCMMFQKILDYFNPDFTLGLTATPERSDMSKEKLLEVCDGNEILNWSVGKAQNYGLVSLFTYHAFYDNVDYSNIEWLGYKYRESDLEEKLLIDKRDEKVIDEYKSHIDDRKTIGFCINIKHAERMQRKFEEAGISSVAVHSELTDETEERRIKEFSDGSVQVIFVVDMFNEGVDFPEASCLLLLRPTYNQRIFWQQIGRGLRRHPSKDICKVFDFVGNEEKAFMVPVWFDVGEGDEKIKPVYEYTPGSKIIFEEKIVDIIEKQRKQQEKEEKCSKKFLEEDLLRVAEEVDEKFTSKVYDEKGRASSRSVMRVFGSWNEALKEIGLKVTTFGSVSEEKLREDLKQTVDEVGGYATQDEHRKRGKYSPRTIGVNLGDGSWVEAMRSIGVDVPTGARRDITKEEAMEDLKRVLENHTGYVGEEVYNKKGKFSDRVFSDLFGSWKAALDEMGLDCPRGYDISNKEESFIEDMKKVNKKTDGMLTIGDYREYGRYGVTTIKDFFGSWSEAKKKIGLEVGVGVQTKISKEEVIRLMKEIDRKISGDNVVSTTQWEKYTSHCPCSVLRCFGSWKNARKEAGVKVEYGYTKDGILDDLRKVSEEVEGKLTSKKYMRYGERSSSIVFSRFDSWNDALKEAGLPIRDVPNEKILREIREMAEEEDGKLRLKDYDKEGSVSGGTVYNRFGPWKEAKKKAGIGGE